MSQTKTITLSMETLNKLYFQFIEKYLIPHLAKTPTELTSLLKNKTAYDVHKYLEDLLKISDNYEGHYIKNHYAIGISHNS
jgi:hypothetical protein